MQYWGLDGHRATEAAYAEGERRRNATAHVLSGPLTAAEVQYLPVGQVVGDTVGGQSFSDETWSALNERCDEPHVAFDYCGARWLLRHVVR